MIRVPRRCSISLANASSPAPESGTGPHCADDDCFDWIELIACAPMPVLQLVIAHSKLAADTR
jgi:hypothetical protein